MLKGENVIYIAHNPWSLLWYRRQQIASRLAEKGNRVLYVEPPTPLWRILARSGRVRRQHIGLREIRRELFVYLPVLLLSPSRLSFLHKINLSLMRTWLKGVVRKLDFTDPILIVNFTPDAESFIGLFNEKIACYDCADAYASRDSLSVKQAGQLRIAETRLIDRCDVVFVTSEPLYAEKKQFKEDTYLLPNGVDLANFTRVLSSETEVAPDIAGIPPPIIGYVGAIKDNIDFDLLRHLAVTSPQWSIVLIGQVRSHKDTERRVKDLERLNNVYVLGERQFKDLPHYIKACSVCIMPYLKIEWIRNSDPIKTYEYMASGKPIVSVDFPAVQRFKDVIRIAGNYDEFTQHVSAALSTTDQDAMEKQVSLAAENSWDHRLEQMSLIVQGYLEKRDLGRR